MTEGEIPLVIDVNPSKKYIDVWLARNEEDPDFDRIKSCFPGYYLVVWRSGTGDLVALTSELLKNNLNLDSSEPPSANHAETQPKPQEPPALSRRPKAPKRQRKRDHAPSL